MANLFISFIVIVSSVVFSDSSGNKASDKSIESVRKNIEVIQSVKVTPMTSVSPEDIDIKNYQKEVDVKESEIQREQEAVSSVILSEPSLRIVLDDKAQNNAVGGIDVLPTAGIIDPNQGVAEGKPPSGYNDDLPVSIEIPGDFIPLEIQGPGGAVTVTEKIH